VAVGDAGAGVFYVILLFFFSTAVYKLLWCPDRPSNLRGNWQDALVILTWDASPTAKNYQVHYRPKGYETIKWQSVRTTNTNRFSVTITNGVPYEIYIVAENLYGFSFGSSTISGCSRAPPPTNLDVAYKRTDDFITLQWTPVMNCKGYVVKRMINNSSSHGLVIMQEVKIFLANLVLFIL
jgi:hypothetical protein